MKIRIILLCIMLVALANSTVHASDGRFNLVHADRSFGKMVDGEKVRYASGNVQAYQDTIRMFCDEAIYYEERNIAEFFGQVLIDDSHHRIWANKIIYYSDTRIAHCLGNVKISGVKDSLYAEKFIYEFRGGNAEAEENLFLWDKESNARIWGDTGQYLADKRESHIEGNARLHHSESAQSDTLIITSRLMSYYGDEPKRALALDSVSILKGGVSARCDSATYFVTEEKVTLRLNPVAWQGESEMIGNEIDFTMDSLKIDQIFLNQKAQIRTLADTLENKFNVLRGKTIQVSLGEGVPEKIVARRNAVSIYRIEEKKIKQGTNSASSDSIIIHFKAGEVDSISIMGGTEGTFYPADWQGEIKSEY